MKNGIISPKILIVEDELIISRNLANIVERQGYAVVGLAANGPAAIQQALQHRPDLILMDIVLEGEMSGIEAVRHIRRHLDVPVVYITSHIEDQILADIKTTGLFGYVLKPIDQREIRVAIEMMLHQQRLEQEIRASRQWLATTLNSIGDGVIATDQQGCVQFMNPVAETLTGWPQNEASGLPLTEVFSIIDELTGQPVDSPVEKVLRTGQTVALSNHTILIARNGHPVPLDDAAAPIKDKTGTINGVVLSFRSLEDRKKAEYEFSTIFNLASQLICIADIHTAMFLRVNPAFTKTLGYSPEELLSQPFLNFVHPDDLAATVEVIKNDLQNGRAVSTFVNRYRCKDGSYRWLDWNSHPDAEKGITFAVAHDFTESKIAKEKIQQALDEKEMLLREIYHRTKNNMQVILSMLGLQAYHIKDEPVLQIFREIQNRIKTMSLVHQRLYDSQHLSRIDLHDYIRDVVMMLVQSYDMPNHIKLDIRTETVVVLFDTALPCGLILNELIGNAIRHAFPGSRPGTITIHLHQFPDGTIELGVNDDGVGLGDPTKLTKPDSFGLMMVYSLAHDQLSGTIDYNTDNGLRCRIRFKDNLYTERV